MPQGGSRTIQEAAYLIAVMPLSDFRRFKARNEKEREAERLIGRALHGDEKALDRFLRYADEYA